MNEPNRPTRGHALKTWPEFFEAVKSGDKTFEVRKNDRDFQVGDLLQLAEFDPNGGGYTYRVLSRRVTYVLLGGQFGIEEGYCVLGLARIPVEVSHQPVSDNPHELEPPLVPTRTRPARDAQVFAHSDYTPVPVPNVEVDDVCF